MRFILPLACFPDVRFLSVLHQASDACHLEVNDHYERQTLRNRYQLVGSQGIIKLSIPCTTLPDKRYSTTTINYRSTWQRTHWRTITACYSRAPYFIYYIDAIEPLFKNSYPSIIEFNSEALRILCEVWNMKVPIHTVEWQHYPTKPCNDLRSWIDPATLQQTSFIEYYQVFSDKNGFVGGCSALDILFNCGPEAPQLFEKTFNQLF
ncbi:MAG: WbqC family protein [Bacteroidia bacterium]